MKWNSTAYTWDSIHQFWNLMDDVGGLSPDPIKIQKLDDAKKKKLVRLVMHMKGIKIYDEKKELKTIHHKLDDIKLVAEEIKKYVQIIH